MPLIEQATSRSFATTSTQYKTGDQVHIGIVASRYPPAPGLLEVQAARLAEGLAARGHSVEVLSTKHYEALADSEIRNGVQVRRFMPMLGTGDEAVPAGMWAFLRQAEGRYDVVHAIGAHSVSTVAAARLAPGAFVMSPLDNGALPVRSNSPLVRNDAALARSVFARAKVVFCASDIEAQVSHTVYQVPLEFIVMTNVFDEISAHEAAYTELVARRRKKSASPTRA